MRTRSILAPAVFSLAGILLSGCGMGPLSSSTSVSSETSASASGFRGKIYGGQQPIYDSYVGLFAAGNTGYGTSATLIASTTTDINGVFAFGNFTCNGVAPVYVLAIGGDPSGTGTGPSNNFSVLGAGLGTCNGTMNANTRNGVVINEVTTVALGYALSHYFAAPTSANATLYDGISDTFGGPGTTPASSPKTYSVGLANADSYTLPLLVNLAAGSANPTSSSTNATTGVVSTVNIEQTKLNSLASAIAQCVNADVSGSQNACTSFFGDTKPANGTTPTDTLQAIVDVALNPTHNVAAIFNDIPTSPIFTPAYTTAPSDWAVVVSYNTSAFGLNVPAGQVSTIDIDANGRVWFPSNVPGTAGIGYFDPAAFTAGGTASAFTGPFDTGIVTPTQVAIDDTGHIWANDLGASKLTEVLTANPSTAANASYPASNPLTSLTINYDGSVIAASSAGSGQYTLLSANGSLASGTAPTVVFPTNGQTYLPYPVASLAGDLADDDGASLNNGTNLEGDVLEYETPSQGVPPYTDAPNFGDSSQGAVPGVAGQIVFTSASSNGGNYIQAHATGGGAPDGLCIFVLSGCYAFGNAVNFQTNPINYGTYGMTLDGGGLLWLTASGGNGLLSTSGTYTNATVINNNVIPYTPILRKAGSKVMPAPFGIAVDNSGNVWMSNATSTSSSNTTPGFTLTEVIGLASPTITPVAAQTQSGSTRTGKEPLY